MTTHYLTDQHLAAYHNHLREEEKAAGTIDKYQRDLRDFVQWLAGDAGVCKERVADWKAHLQTQGLAPVTINSKLAALNSLFRFLGWEDCRVRFLKIQRRPFRDAARELHRSDYDRLVAAARKRSNKRLALVMETLCATGMRVSELAYITVEAARRGRADISLKGKIRVVLLPERLCRKLLNYAAKQKIACGELFLTASGKRLSRRQIWSEMKHLAVCAGVNPQKVFPHNLRHLFATVFYAACRDIVRLADVLGHSSIDTTRIYLTTSGDEHRRYLEKLRLVL